MPQHPDVPAAASHWSERQVLHIASAYSNPFRWQTRRELANDFRRHVAHMPNAVLHMVELAYGDRPFEVTDRSNPNDIQLRTRHELFHKENLLNLAVRSFPPDWKWGSIADADFHFTRHDVALETIHQLQHYDWVQMFSSYLNLTGEATPGAGHRPAGQVSNGFAYSFVRNGNRLPDGYAGGWAEPPRSADQPQIPLPWVGAPGGAWAFRRSAFDAVGGLLERCILGSADWFMAFGLSGQITDTKVERRLGKRSDLYRPSYLEYIRSWQRRAKAAFGGNIGYVDSFATHHFHGPMVKRGYADRDSILIANEFCPVSDVYPDWQGVLQLTDDKPSLGAGVRGYFLSRVEDSE